MSIKKFELGKCYRHTTGSEMKIVGLACSTMYGQCFIAENAMPDLDKNSKSDIENNNAVIGTPKGYVHCEFSAIGLGKDNAVNWKEITEEQWMKNFS